MHICAYYRTTYKIHGMCQTRCKLLYECAAELNFVSIQYYIGCWTYFVCPLYRRKLYVPTPIWKNNWIITSFEDLFLGARMHLIITAYVTVQLNGIVIDLIIIVLNTSIIIGDARHTLAKCTRYLNQLHRI